VAPVAPPPASLTDLSLKVIAAVATGKLDRTLFSDNFTIAEVGPQVAGLGKLQSFTYDKGIMTPDYPVYAYTVKFEKATVHELIGVDKAGKVDTWMLKP